MADDKTKLFTTASPYYLHPSENPGSLISHVQLKEENYEEWARSMKNTLRAKKKLGFVDGTLEKPDDAFTEKEDWWMVNSMLVAWILNTIEPVLHSTVTYTKDLKDLWVDLRQRFSIENGARVDQLKSNLAACKQHGQFVVQYYGKLKMMWDERIHYEPIPMCTCGGCECGITKLIEKKTEEERTHKFLMDSDDGVYGVVCSNMLSQDPLPNLKRVYSMMVQEERHHAMTIINEESVAVAVVGFSIQVVPKAAVARGKEKSGTCNHCGRTGHDVTECFPSDWVP